jgi:hypothetical protein
VTLTVPLAKILTAVTNPHDPAATHLHLVQAHMEAMKLFEDLGTVATTETYRKAEVEAAETNRNNVILQLAKAGQAGSGRNQAQGSSNEKAGEHFRQDRMQDRPKHTPAKDPGCPSQAVWQSWWDNKKCFRHMLKLQNPKDNHYTGCRHTGPHGGLDHPASL